MAGWEKGLFRTTHQRENVSGLLLLITLPPDWLVGEVQEVSGRYQFEKLFQNRISLVIKFNETILKSKMIKRNECVYFEGMKNPIFAN